MTDAQRVEAAMGRFGAFFAELRTAFFEREDVLHQIALALLCREHTLLTGPPGTAKSALASAVFGRILCEQTGAPSLYARQITESTVQTDLIGPIDFKNLMETGRTTHFTDEGMLGSVHAFLDEVFDGRDMLLRSALNVLQERELKQGGRITRGQIECALMTSNRYIADVIDNARETLLAFVDRIAFIAFVPRGFADPKNMRRVLSRHVARASSSRLDALLTIQDLDVLQELTARVRVSEAICGAMATLTEQLHSEINQAARADSSFIPTRYLSTRTVVRCGRVLQAQCVYDRIFSGPRPMQVLAYDLPALRLHLLLGGPQPEQIEALSEHESDPHERRQLQIVRTEREIFDRCLSKLPKIEDPPPTSAPLSQLFSLQSEPPPPPEPGAPESPLNALSMAVKEGDLAQLTHAIRELSVLCGATDPHADAARVLLEDAVARLNEVAFRAGLSAAGDHQTELLSAVSQLVQLTNAVADDSVALHGVAQWLRAQSEHMIRAAIAHLGGSSGALLGAVHTGADDMTQLFEDCLAVVEDLAHLRASVRTASAPAEPEDEAWEAAIDVVEDDLAVLWDALFCRTIEQLLAKDEGVALSAVLDTAAPQLQLLKQAEARLEAVRHGPSGITRKAVGARLTTVIEARMSAITEIERRTLSDEIERVHEQLAAFQLGGAVTPRQWLLWCAEALLRAAPEVTAPQEPSYEAYRALRDDEQRVPVAYIMCEVALQVAPEVSRTGVQTAADMTRVAELLAELPETLQDGLITLEISRIRRALDLIAQWWKQLSSGDMSVSERLDMVVRSRLYDVLWDELALARYTLESKLVADAFPRAADASAALCERIDELEEITRRGAQALLRSRTDEAWAAALAHER